MLEPTRDPPSAQRCERFYALLDAAVDEAGVADAQAARIAGFPHLRVDRESIGSARATLVGARFSEWISALAALDATARRLEVRNLPADSRETLTLRLAEAGLPSIDDGLGGCPAVLRAADDRRPDTWALLLDRARVPDDYDEAQRALGLYPLVTPFVGAGVRAWEQETLRTFEAALASLPRVGRRVRYQPAAGSASVSRAELARAGAFGDPEGVGAIVLAADLRERLFAAYAPVIEVDEAGDYDRIGAPLWRADRRPDIDPGRAVVYTHLASTRYRGLRLPQLVYVAWFSERPLASPSDLLGGRLDGIAWRVTLAPDGTPLVYDTIHPCGCYHLFVPTDRALSRAQAPTLGESTLVVQRLPVPGDGERTVLHLSSAAHYLQRVSVESVASAPAPMAPPTPLAVAAADYAYGFAPLDTLRSLPWPGGGYRSLFGPDGLVTGTERNERWLLWPTGVRSPGAMRQWGRHATAFVGRRHFDDPFLFEQSFTFTLSMAPPAPGAPAGSDPR